MSADISQFQSYLEKKREATIEEKDRQAEIAKATAIHVEHITHDPEWNIYIQKLQVHVDRMEAHRDDCLNNMPKAMPREVSDSLKYEYWKTVGFLEALDIAMKMPKQIMEAVHEKGSNS